MTKQDKQSWNKGRADAMRRPNAPASPLSCAPPIHQLSFYS